MKTNQCDRRRIDEFFQDENVGTDVEWTQHLETCEDCREYFDSQAAQPEQWAEAGRMLRPTDFDVASTAEFSAGGQGDRERSM